MQIQGRGEPPASLFSPRFNVACNSFPVYSAFSHDVTAAILWSKTMKRRPCWCPKPVLWELNSFLMQTSSFVPYICILLDTGHVSENALYSFHL